MAPSKYYCAEIFRATPESLTLPFKERQRFVQEVLIASADGPDGWDEDTFAVQAPMKWPEEAIVIMFFAMLMGGPLFVFISGIYLSFFGSWWNCALWMVVVAALSFHPLPSPEAMQQARFTICLYKYFSYRFMWCDDERKQIDESPAWIAAGAPHGVLPIANILSMPAINIFAGKDRRFYGAAAGIVLRTPFLRYMGVFGLIDVSASSIIKTCNAGYCVGIVPDGIAGIFKVRERDEIVCMKDRKGLAKLALRTGIPIVPAYSLGNTACYSNWYDRFGILESLSRFLRTSIFIFWGRWGLPIPYRVNVTVLFGPPLKVEPNAKPSQAEIDDTHTKILGLMEAAFERHKAACGWKHRTMKFC